MYLLGILEGNDNDRGLTFRWATATATASFIHRSLNAGTFIERRRRRSPSIEDKQQS